jgi:hypothetical protein
MRLSRKLVARTIKNVKARSVLTETVFTVRSMHTGRVSKVIMPMARKPIVGMTPYCETERPDVNMGAVEILDVMDR